MKNISKPLTWLAAALLLLGAGAYFRLASIHPRLEAMILLVLLSGGFMVFWSIQKKLQREKNLGHLETERLLAAQEDTNRKLVQANRLAQDGAQKLAVTLDSIGDAVIATDAQAHITLLNPVAQKLTGWTLAQAIGQPVDEVFKIVNKANREPVTVPVLATLAHGTVQGLANHTLLLSRDGREYDIADSCAPIRDANGQVVGAVLVFRNVTEEYAAQQALRQVSALQKAIFNSANFSSIATDAKGVIQIFNVGAQRMLGYTAAEVVNRVTPADLSDPQEMVARATSLSLELGTEIAAGFESLAFKASRGIEDIDERTYICKDGHRLPALVSVTALRDEVDAIIGYLLIGTDNTARKEAEEALLKAGALQSAIFNSANFSSIATDAKGVIQIFNVGAERMLGYSAAEVMNKITPADISDPQELIARAETLSVELGTPITPGFESLVFKASRGIEDIYELTYIRKDGTRFPAVVNVTALRDAQDAIIGYLLIGTDNTARKEAEEALLQAGALQNAIFNSANFSSIATDAKGVIQIFNVGAERMLGYTAAEVVNRVTPADISDRQELLARAASLSQELDAAISPGFEALVFKASRGIEDIYELTYLCKDRSRLPAMVSVTALRDEAEAIIGYLLIGTDNTARRAAEVERERLDRALRDKNTELEAARAAADKANQAKSEFLSGMSHELRSPLNAILGFAQLMESGTPLPTLSQKASIDQILRAGWYLLELINEVLDLALIESGRLSLSREPVSLPDVLQDCQTLMASAALKKEVSLHFAPLAAPCFVSADHTRLKQVVINLLSNAIKYNRHGGSVTVSCSERAAGRVRLSVQDTGEGLSADKLAQLFQPFNRLGKEDSDEEGTGIGLVVSKRLVEQMGGELGVISSVGAGCVFWVELALVGVPQFSDVEAEMLLSHVTPTVNGERVRTLLYVEDNRANMELVRQLIARRPDLRLFGAEDATRGIALAREHQPDLILLDINLPGINGLQALKILQEDEGTRHIPVLALSANAMPRDIERGLAAGFLRYLTKPIRVTEFMDALDAGLALAQTRRAPGLGQEVLDAT